MPDTDRLSALLRRLDGAPYAAYKQLKGTWRLRGLALLVGTHLRDGLLVRLRVVLDRDLGGHTSDGEGAAAGLVPDAGQIEFI